MPEPVRTCIGCGAKREKRTLVRLTLCEGQARVDGTQPAGGRGAYLCGEECARRAVARRTLGRAFRQRAAASPGLVEEVAGRARGPCRPGTGDGSGG